MRGDATLLADLYLAEGATPAPLIVWMHSGGFRNGSRSHRSHRRIAAGFNARGYAMAFIDYRLARPPAILRPATEAALPALIADAEAACEEMHPTFFGPRALAVVEDCCAFLAFIGTRRDEFRLSGRIILAGSSAGAISALNTLYLPERIGLTRPPVSTLWAFSGGFAYPSFLAPTGARLLAIHGANDPKVPVSSIRRLARLCPDDCTLLEDPANDHGSPCLTPAEPLWKAIERCVAHDRAG